MRMIITNVKNCPTCNRRLSSKHEPKRARRREVWNDLLTKYYQKDEKKKLPHPMMSEDFGLFFS